MLVDRAVAGDACAGGLRTAQGHLGLGGGLGAVDAGFDEGLGELKSLAVGFDGLVVDVLEGILPAELEVELGQAGLLGEALVFEIGGGDLGGVLVFADLVADAAPEIRLPGDVEREARGW